MARFPVLMSNVMAALLLFANVPGLAAEPLASPDPPTAFPGSALALANQALTSRVGLADAATLDRERANLDTASSLLAILQEPDAFARTIALAQEGSRAQARRLGLAWSDAPLPAHASPSEAASALLAFHATTPAPEQAQDLLRLDMRQEPARAALTRVLDAFLAFDVATRQAYAHADAAALRSLQDAATQERADIHAGRSFEGLGPSLPDAGVDFSPVFPARSAFLAAVTSLRDALELRSTGAPAAACSPVAVPPVFSIDLATCDNTYDVNLALLLDVGGNDVYLNNAGGSHIVGSGETGCSTPPADLGAAAALVDLGGNDRYTSGKHCGINGGAWLGSGFLLDASGDDTYTGGTTGTNGGAFGGLGFLLDGGGGDAYTASSDGTNGGGDLAGAGFLLDAGGDDTYAAGSEGTNGGGNGLSSGSYVLATGFLFDAAGNDMYTSRSAGSNGGAELGGVGFLLDAGGDDAYITGGVGANGGGDRGSAVGFLLDAGGHDTYSAGDRSTNGGAYGYDGGTTANSIGFLLDAGGDDTYTARGRGANGGGDSAGVGFLIDASGRDTYTAGDQGTNGGGFDVGVGFLYDGGAHDDTYTAGDEGANGGGNLAGVGLLFDGGGDDTYTAGAGGTNGGGALGAGLLLDQAGRDTYQDPAVPGGVCVDCTIVPKGVAGAQIDSDDRAP